MKLTYIALSTLAALAMVSQAQAADLTVKGEITPPACHVSMAGGGVLDWGPMPHSDLLANGFKVLEAKDATLVITCDPGTKASFAVQTTRSDDSQITGGGGQHDFANRVFGLGFDPVVPTRKLGNFIMLHKSGTYDSVSATERGTGTRGQASDNYQRSVLASDIYATVTDAEEYTLLDNTTHKPASATIFNYVWSVQPALNKKSEITSTQTVPLLGKAILTVRYL